MLSAPLVLSAFRGTDVSQQFSDRKGTVSAVSLATALVAIYFLTHLYTYGKPFPNTVYVKAPEASVGKLLNGLSYLWHGPTGGYSPAFTPVDLSTGYSYADSIYPREASLVYLCFVGLPALIWVLSYFRRPWVSQSAAKHLRSLTYVPMGILGLALLAGGDFYIGWRFVVPLFPVTALILYLSYGSSHKCMHDLARSRSSTPWEEAADVLVAGTQP